MPEETTNSVLKSVRAAVGLQQDVTAFDTELLIHINSAFATLHQNGVGTPIVVVDDTQTWDDFRDENQVMGNYMFEQCKMFVYIKTRILFDPPPPSTVKYMDEASKETLWRLREAYDVPEGSE